MNEIAVKSPDNYGIDNVCLKNALKESLKLTDKKLRRVLLIPPDYSRKYSAGGRITAIFYDLLKDHCTVDIMPGVGSHEPVSTQERLEMFGCAIPEERFLYHDWRKDVVKIGEIPAGFITEVSEGLEQDAIDVEVNRRLFDGSYDLIISIGQVVPHEIAGMANYSKNIFVGCGGWSMISRTHMLGAFFGMERIMGRDQTPVRRIFDYAENNFLGSVPLLYVLTVTTKRQEEALLHGLFIGRDRSIFEQAVELSREKNIHFVDRPIKKVVAYLEEKEFKSTWIGNKAVYRTRMAIADGGELLILAPGIRMFGEDAVNDSLIRKYGYKGREQVLEWRHNRKDIAENLSVAAHLIHGSSDGRFDITYAAALMSQAEIENAGYRYVPYMDAAARYDPEKLKEGFNRLDDGEEIYFIGNPALGLWAERRRMEDRYEGFGN